MSNFTKLPRLIAIPPNYELFKVPTAFEYHVGEEGSGEVISVPEGFITDGASIPKIFYSLIGGPLGKYAAPAVLHDYLYHIKKYTRRRSDQIFLEAMKVRGVSWWKRHTMFTAVRLAGWIPWKNSKPLLPIILLLLIPLLSGCMFLRISVLKADGKGIGGAYALVSGNAKRMDLIGIGYTVLTTEKLDEELLRSLPKVLIKVDSDNKVKEVSVETHD